MGSLIGVVCGIASALFLWLLQLVTDFRGENSAIVYALPLAGLAMGLILERFGGTSRRGNDLVIETIHDCDAKIPLRMAPFALFGTVFTHLFGGSAGREGTAVQMGATLSDWLAHRLTFALSIRKELLVAGVAGGFGSVFGTPIAGVIFAVEFVTLGRLQMRALWPAIIAAAIADKVTRSLGIVHTAYPLISSVSLSAALLLKWLLFAGAVAVVAIGFIELTHFIKRSSDKVLPRLPVRMLVGGIAVVILWQLIGHDAYLGLGLPTIERSFSDLSVPHYAFALKLLFTAITLGTGFLGGEVTPLFFMGATLGSVLAQVLGIPLDLAAGVGMAAMFAAASNTPLALSIMAVELMGIAIFPHVLIVCAAAFLLSGHRSIYRSQRLHRRKTGAKLAQPIAISALKSRQK